MKTFKPMYERDRLLKQFALPTSQMQAFVVSWDRPTDLFGDRFNLHASVESHAITFEFTHSPFNASMQKIWTLKIESLNGRARIASFHGDIAAIKTIQQAVDHIGATHEQMKAVPLLNQVSSKIKTKRLKNTTRNTNSPKNT